MPLDEALLSRLLGTFLIGLSVTLAGALAGAAASLLTGGHPMDRLRFLAEEMRLWGMLVAMSGSFEPLRNIGQGLFDGQMRGMLRQILLMLAAMLGAHIGFLVLQQVAGKKP